MISVHFSLQLSECVTIGVAVGIAGLSAFEGNAVLSGLTGVLGAFLAFQVKEMTKKIRYWQIVNHGDTPLYLHVLV